MVGQVRRVLVAHARGAVEDHLDPNGLRPAAELARAVADDHGRDDGRKLAHAYVALWARTFRPLVRHLRGRPERAMHVFAAEVYPYLRGDRLASRVDQVGPRGGRLVLAGGLPEGYRVGLAESFVALSGARVEAESEGDVVHLRWRLSGLDRLSRWAQGMAILRVPLVAAALLSVALGLALALNLHGSLDPGRAALVLVGAVSAQAAANALQDRRHGRAVGLLGPLQAGPRLLNATVRGGYALAGVCALVLAVEQPLVLLLAGAGLGVSALFGRFRDHGLGPLLAGLTYGPLLPLGVVIAMGGITADAWVHMLGTLPLGLLASAMLYLDDMADRPLDEASGQRTLLVRLPKESRFAGLAGIVVAALALCLAHAWGGPGQVPALALAAVGALALVEVHRHADDPRRLAPARFVMFMILAATSGLQMLAILGGPA